MADAGDSVWLGGRIFTGRSWTEGMAVENGRVLALGSSQEVRASSGTGAMRHDLGGRLLIPGLVDSHLHLQDSVVRAEGVDLAGVREWSELERRVRSWSEAHPGAVVLGGGWDEELLPDRRRPDRTWLDRLVPDRPAILHRVCTHLSVANSAALQELGLDRSTPDPPGGRVGRSRDGEPDGLLFDNALHGTGRFARTLFRRFDREIRRVLSRWAAEGLTAVGAVSAEPEEVEHLRRLEEADHLPVRVHAYLRMDRWRAGSVPAPFLPTARVSIDGVKVVLDGSLGARTAWLSEPYSDAPSEVGHSLWEFSALAPALGTAVAEGWRPALHAIGDRAMREALRLLEELRPPQGARIEHLSVTPPELLGRIARTGAVAVVQPRFRTSDLWVRERLGEKRASWVYAFRDLRDRGVPLAGSSDSPVEPADPWTGLRAATVPPGGSAVGQALTLLEALGLYTVGAGAALARPERGALLVGGPADFVVVDRPSLESALQAPSPPIRETWLEGKPVFRAEEPSGRSP
jgi:hypothetical protein